MYTHGRKIFVERVFVLWKNWIDVFVILFRAFPEKFATFSGKFGCVMHCCFIENIYLHLCAKAKSMVE